MTRNLTEGKGETCGQVENDIDRRERYAEKLQLITGLSPGMMTKDPWGSIATRQALRMLGVSAAEMPHILQVSFRRLLRDWRFLLLSRMLQSGKDSGSSLPVHGSTPVASWSDGAKTYLVKLRENDKIRLSSAPYRD